MMFVQIFLVIEEWGDPFELHWLNQLENLALSFDLAQCFFALGLFFAIDEGTGVGETLSFLCSLVILALNLVFIFRWAWVWYNKSEYKKNLGDKLISIKRSTGLGSIHSFLRQNSNYRAKQSNSDSTQQQEVENETSYSTSRKTQRKSLRYSKPILPTSAAAAATAVTNTVTKEGKVEMVELKEASEVQRNMEISIHFSEEQKKQELEKEKATRSSRLNRLNSIKSRRKLSIEQRDTMGRKTKAAKL